MAPVKGGNVGAWPEMVRACLPRPACQDQVIQVGDPLKQWQRRVAERLRRRWYIRNPQEFAGKAGAIAPHPGFERSRVDQARIISLLARICTFAAILAVGAAASAQPARPGVPVSVAKSARHDVPIVLTALGTVQAYYTAQLRPKVDGTLIAVPVVEGQQVKQGDVVAVIDPRPYQAALDIVAAKKQQDQALLANAQADFTRYSSLARQDFASRQQVETQAALVKQFTAAILGDNAQIETAQLNLSFCSITAPFDGRVGLRNLDPGNVVRAAEAVPIVSVAQIEPITVTFTLPQDNLPAVTDALSQGKPPVIAYAGDGTTELDRGTLLTLDNAIDPATGTIKLKATFTNARHRLWPGQFVHISLILGTDRDVLAIPSIAVQHGPSDLFVYVVKPDSTVAVQRIEVAREQDGLSVIRSGLTDGQNVVAEGQSRLQSGTRVTVREITSPAPQVGSGG